MFLRERCTVTAKPGALVIVHCLGSIMLLHVRADAELGLLAFAIRAMTIWQQKARGALHLIGVGVMVS